MTYLLDTNIFSDLMREHPKLDSYLASLSIADRVIICSVVRGEILYGIKRLPVSKRRQDLMLKASRLFSILPCESIPETAGDFYAAIKIDRQLKGLALDENDLWIASTALALGTVLVTRDTDFHQIDNLVIENWTE